MLIRATEADTTFDEAEPQLQQQSSVGIELPGFESRRKTQLSDTHSQRASEDTSDKSAAGDPQMA